MSWAVSPLQFLHVGGQEALSVNFPVHITICRLITRQKGISRNSSTEEGVFCTSSQSQDIVCTTKPARREVWNKGYVSYDAQKTNYW